MTGQADLVELSCRGCEWTGDRDGQAEHSLSTGHIAYTSQSEIERTYVELRRAAEAVLELLALGEDVPPGEYEALRRAIESPTTGGR